NTIKPEQRTTSFAQNNVDDTSRLPTPSMRSGNINNSDAIETTAPVRSFESTDNIIAITSSTSLKMPPNLTRDKNANNANSPNAYLASPMLLYRVICPIMICETATYTATNA